MKVPVRIVCPSCGFNFGASGYGEKDIPPAKCPQCGALIHFVEEPTFSIVADRLLLRSRHEIAEADFTVSIICGAMAVECALTCLFMKWKTLDHRLSKGQEPTEEEKREWEREYKKKASPGGFEKSADFVSVSLTGKTYDEFVTDFISMSNKAELIRANFPQYESKTKARHIHNALFDKRNRIMHWGKVTYDKDDASAGLDAASAVISLLKEMDRKKYLAMEQGLRSSSNNSVPS